MPAIGIGLGVPFNKRISNYHGIDYSSLSFLGGSIDFVNNLWLDESGNNNNISFKNASARSSDSGNLDYVVTGLLTSDTVEVVTGSDIPTIPSNGVLRISEGQVVYGVTIKRSGAVFATIPFCEPIYNSNIPFTSYDVSGNGHHATCSVLTSGNIVTQNNYFYLLQHGYNYKKVTYKSNFTTGLDGGSMLFNSGVGGTGTCTSDGTRLNVNVTTQPSLSSTSYPRFVRNNTLTVGIKTKVTVKGTGIISAYNWGTYVNIVDIDLSLQDWVMEFIPTTTTLYLIFNGLTKESFSLDSILIEQYYIVPAVATTDALGRDVEIIQDGNNWLSYSGDIQLPIVANNPKLSTIIISGLCVVGKAYFIEKTQTDHFGVGKVAGGTFTSNGTEVVDINNQVREILSPYFFSDGNNSIIKTFDDFTNWRAHLYYNKMDVSSIDTGGYFRDSFRMSKLAVLKDGVFVTNDQHRKLNSYYSFNQNIDFPLVGFSWDHTTPVEIPLLNNVFGAIKQTYFINYGGYLTNSEIVGIRDNLHEIGVHTWWEEEINHYPPERKGFYETSENYTEEQLDLYYKDLQAYYTSLLGEAIQTKAYPGGQAEAFSKMLCMKYFKFGRGISNTYNALNYKQIPSTDWSYIYSESLDVIKYNEIVALIDDAINSGMRFISLYGHPGTWDGSKFNASGGIDANGKDQYGWMADILTYIRAKQNAGTEVRVVTLKQIYDIVNQLI